jgi:CheY-like chemotaxis protein
VNIKSSPVDLVGTSLLDASYRLTPTKADFRQASSGAGLKWWWASTVKSGTSKAKFYYRGRVAFVSREFELSTPTILVIEDNVADVFPLRYALDHSQFDGTIEVLSDGEAALQYLGEHRSGVRAHSPCVILLDLYLPKFNGIEVLAAIREEPVLKHIHVVVLTSYATRKQMAELEARGALCRSKPSSLDCFLVLIDEIVTLCKTPVPAQVSA